VNEYADFRESLKLLTYSIHCCVESEGTAAGGLRAFVHCSAKQRGRARRVQLGWVWVQIDSLQDPSRLLGASSTKRDLVPH
jgi:hypothetical protein